MFRAFQFKNDDLEHMLHNELRFPSSFPSENLTNWSKLKGEQRERERESEKKKERDIVEILRILLV